MSVLLINWADMNILIQKMWSDYAVLYICKIFIQIVKTTELKMYDDL